MYTKRVVFRAVAGVALTATLTGGTALMAGATDADGREPDVASSAFAVTSEVAAADTSGASTVAKMDRGRGDSTSQAGTDDGAQPAGPDRAQPAGPAHCEDAQLTMDYRERPERSTPEVVGFDLVFTNIGSRPCSFDGWPGLVAEDADGRTLTWALASGSTSTLVVLPPNGGMAVAEGTADLPSASGCAAATSDHLRAYISSDGAGGGIVDDARVAVCIDGTWTLQLGALTAFHGAPGEVTTPETPTPEEPTPLPAKCQDEQLALEFVSRPDLSVAGASGFELVFTNTTDAQCSMWGWPGLVVESADGTRIGSSWTVGEMVEPFVLANGESAVVLGTAPDPAAWGCEPMAADHLRAYITSDGAGPGVIGTASISVCTDGSTVLEIGALMPA
ncbi:DUF4232 domain-containing protein [Agromyces sp. NPDC056523]|uniref:DUF4232 domain-containing protein n=1 Tax=Agromyces sp. NPDC056523 TaxID=3345850 RepID=UPI00366C87DE